MSNTYLRMNDTCKHCGTSYRSGEVAGGFCCSGCEHVYRLIRDEGFDEYYKLQDQVGRPLRKTPFSHRELLWVGPLQASAETNSTAPELRLRIGGMSCLGCVWLIERLSRRTAGVSIARVSLEGQSLHLCWRAGELNLKVLVEELQRFGYRAEPLEWGALRPVSALAWRVILCGIFAGNSLLLAMPQFMGLDGFVYADLFFLLSLLFAGLIFAVGGALFILSAWRSLRCLRVSYDVFAGVFVLGSLLFAVVVPLFDSEIEVQFWRFSLCVFLFLFGQWLYLFIRRGWNAQRN
jgi:P-type Cu2+ transporter